MEDGLVDFLKELAVNEAKNITKAKSLAKNDKPIQYLRINKEMEINDLSSGRYTTIAKGVNGYILDEEKIALLPGATWGKKQKMIKEMMDAYDRNLIYALVGAYPCALNEESYELLDVAPMLCIGELI